MERADAVVVGAGPAGLGTALFLARRGARVALVEPEIGPPADATPDDDFDRWSQRAVPQARQSHACLGLGARVLAEEAPDVVDAMRERGVLELPASFQGNGVVDGVSRLHARRLVFEAALRRAVVGREHGVHTVDDSVAAFLGEAAHPSHPPRVTGVVTGTGKKIAAPVVVDATGRRSAVQDRVAALGVGTLPIDIHPIGLQYYTRFYRLHADVDFPSTDSPINARLPYMAAMAFPGDNRTFSLTIACFVDDPYRRALADVTAFERVLGAVPLTQAWTTVGDPISPVHAMARIENRWQRLVDNAGLPLVDGVVLVGDGSMHTNPTFGRGLSLAFEQAQQLARAAVEHAGEPGFTAEFEQWIHDRQSSWFQLQVAADKTMVARFRATTRGVDFVPPSDPTSWIPVAAMAAAPTDDVVARAMTRFAHMLDTPAAIFGDPDVRRRLDAFVAVNGLAPPAVDGPSRTDFEAMLESAAR